MSKSYQLGALMKKNLILMKRNCFATCCEIFFPIVLMILLVMVRRAITIGDYSEPTDDQLFLYTNSSAYISFSDKQQKVDNLKVNLG